jgi:hypothetical protein
MTVRSIADFSLINLIRIMYQSVAMYPHIKSEKGEEKFEIVACSWIRGNDQALTWGSFEKKS